MTKATGAALLGGGTLWMAGLMQRQRMAGLLLGSLGIALLLRGMRQAAWRGMVREDATAGNLRSNQAGD